MALPAGLVTGGSAPEKGETARPDRKRLATQGYSSLDSVFDGKASFGRIVPESHAASGHQITPIVQHPSGSRSVA